MSLLFSLAYARTRVLLLLLVTTGCGAAPKPLPAQEATVILIERGQRTARWMRARNVVWRYERSLTFENAATGSQITVTTSTGALIVIEGGKRTVLD